MDLTWFFTLSLCYKPRLIVSNSEIEDGQTVKVTCTLPIGYTGGECRLYRENSQMPFERKTTRDFLCTFYLTSEQLLGSQPVGSRIYFQCNYHLQQYTSVLSDIAGVTIWGSRPSPALSVSRRVVSPDDSVEVTCSPPQHYVSSCSFYREEIRIASGSCSRNLTGKSLIIWERSATLLRVNLTCKYFPDQHLDIRSEPSKHSLLFVVDPSQASSSVRCKVPVDDDQLAEFAGSSRTVFGADGRTVTLVVTNSSLTSSVTCG